MNAHDKRIAAAKLRESASAIRQDAQYTDSAEARMHQENIARQHETEAFKLEAQANALDAYTLGQVREVLSQFHIGTHISKQEALDKIARLVEVF